ncbi:MAG: alpha/beta hydrolase [Clostridia bacterium]|nr:alpha/beta hydrolase [Clostridia bacterium]
MRKGWTDVNGIRLCYAKAGEGSRDAVLVHGNGEDHRLFDRVIPRLVSAGFCVYAPDSRGHGESTPVSEYHYADMAEDIFRFIRCLGLKKPLLYGHSDGGIIGLLLEMSHPGTLGLLAVSGANLCPEGLDRGLIAELEERVRKAPDPLAELMLTEPHIDPACLRTIRIPTLVMAGEWDLVLPRETRRIAESLPYGQLVTVKGADHGSYVTDGTAAVRVLEFALAHEKPEGDYS